MTSPVQRLPRVAIIGAGSSGIAAAKALYDAGIPFDCFERGSRVGGNWVFKNDNGMSAAYRSLHINTSRDRMQYADFPMPDSYPDFPHHSLIAEYFEQYVDHFGIRHKITFNTSVESVARQADGTFVVTRDDGGRRRYDAVMVANGHHWDPRWPQPEIPGDFAGDELHSHSYIDPDEPLALRGKRVVVVGMGNSAMDIACELAHRGVAARTIVSARRGAWVIPKYLFGRPLDQLSVLGTGLPLRARQWLARALHRLAVGRMEDYGLPEPQHDLAAAHPTISSGFLPMVGSGDIEIRPQIVRFEGDVVVFEDGQREEVDAVVYCTGYNVTFPFFDDELINAPDNELPLYLRVFKPELRGVFFIGLLQPLGAIMPIAEAQSKLVASYLRGEYALPTQGEMWLDIERDREAMAARYVASPRHTMQVDFDDYMRRLEREARKGRARAGRRQVLPIPARVETTRFDRGEDRAAATVAATR